MAIEGTKEFDLERIQHEMNIKSKTIKNCQIDIVELEKIYNNFQINNAKMEKIRTELLAVLNENLCGNVHSIRARVKDADHLIEKIIRNYKDKPSKYRKLNVDNYNKIITDLIGIRIIILDKRDWKDIHHSLLKIFRNLPNRYAKLPEDIILNYDKYKTEAEKPQQELAMSYHAEKPVVYITSDDDRKIYVDDYLKVDNSKTHYRSIHYIVRYKDVYFEIQVRTLFEEGWLEFDHRIKYPYDQNNSKKQEYARILSNLAISADELISFYNNADFEQEVDDDIDDTKNIMSEEDVNVADKEEQTLKCAMIKLF